MNISAELTHPSTVIIWKGGWVGWSADAELKRRNRPGDRHGSRHTVSLTTAAPNFARCRPSSRYHLDAMRGCTYQNGPSWMANECLFHSLSCFETRWSYPRGGGKNHKHKKYMNINPLKEFIKGKVFPGRGTRQTKGKTELN